MNKGVGIGECECIRETDKAILLVRGGDPSDTVWVPKSQIHDDSEVWEEEQTGDAVVNEWFARAAGLI